MTQRLNNVTGSRKWIIVAGARPNFMKVGPLIRAIDKHNSSCRSSLAGIHYLLVHTGQHYDFNMSDAFFVDLKLPEPDVHLGVGSGNHGEQTGRVLIEVEKVLLKERPDLVIVVGDVNSTMAAALAAVKLHIPVAHVEAGLRSFDRNMPEEVNRLVTDVVSDYLFTPSPEGDENLLKEGIPKEKIFLVGDIMVDSLLFHLEEAKKSTILHKLSLTNSKLTNQTNQINKTTPYALLTVHRPANVDDKVSLERIISGILEVAAHIPVLFPVHPRTARQIKAFGLVSAFEFHNSKDLKPGQYYKDCVLKRKIHCFDPLGYHDFLNLMAHAAVVLTDSGGIQEETTVLNIPCITLRDTTERPITLTEGTNVLVHDDPQKIVAETNKVLSGYHRKAKCPAIWDGHTADRIVRILAEET
jgi:UDP-N-acetylglucosamine 2-epimerase (non-hydrolysing)